MDMALLTGSPACVARGDVLPCPIEMTAPTFTTLLTAHEALETVFWHHQELLVLPAPLQALEVLKVYRHLLSVHLEQEERFLFPIFEREPAHPRWPLVLYAGQHAKLLKLLDRCLTSLERAVPQQGVTRRFVVQLLELETTYKHLLEHHDGAERQGFFPALDEKSTPTERTEVLDRCLSEWNLALSEQQAVLADAERRLSEAPP